MGKSGLAVFEDDLAYADKARLRLNSFYQEHARSGRFVAIERSPGSLWIQRNAHVDCIVASKRGGSVTVEEKIVRWPGYPYSAMTLETHSNFERTGQLAEGDGWMYTSVADLLLYGFQQEDARILVWLFRLPELQAWFRGNELAYRVADTPNEHYTTRCRIVPLSDVPESAVVMSKVSV